MSRVLLLRLYRPVAVWEDEYGAVWWRCPWEFPHGVPGGSCWGVNESNGRVYKWSA